MKINVLVVIMMVTVAASVNAKREDHSVAARLEALEMSVHGVQQLNIIGRIVQLEADKVILDNRITTLENDLIPRVTALEDDLIPRVTALEDDLIPRVTALEDDLIPRVTALEDDLIPRVTALEDDLIPRVTDLENDLIPRVTDLENLMLDSRVSVLEALVPTCKKCAVFSVNTWGLHSVVGERVKHGGIQTNVDNVYDTTTGEFTAPCDGLYSFSASACTKAGKEGVLKIERSSGNRIIAPKLRVGDQQFEDCNSINRILHLSENEKVWMVVDSGEFGSDLHKSFIGFLIKSDT